MVNKLAIFWFRRDLRLEDNVALFNALNSSNKVVPIFIFDEEILDNLPKNDARVSFIYQTLEQLDTDLKAIGSSLLIKKGNPLEVWKTITSEFDISAVYTNKDYEPYALQRDAEIHDFLKSKSIDFLSYKDQVIFEKAEVTKNDGLPYTVYTPYKNKWLQKFNAEEDLKNYDINFNNFYQFTSEIPSLKFIGFNESSIKVTPYNLSNLANYDEIRDFPFIDKTSYLSPYFRFGLVSVRKMVQFALKTNATFLNELIWREFFMQVLFHFPKVVTNNFKQKYDAVPWRNNEAEFEKWCKGETGYPMVDAGMRQLNKTGYMHNRVRMITAGFLCKHLLIDWRWGEAYFAEKLLDYELSANNGNWQWSAGTGCDAAPYFRVFNPEAQLKKFDKELQYIRKWIKNFDELTYPQPMVEHKFARKRAISTYKEALN
ncbi:cryptochrome/photolyase family protein [Tenacibaculum finnmarkense]|uniref:Deoxyribodipyrimidine photo-lyase n=1 Tax=Tenacibaculum finnmarkense genomovar finnmarkense TaxID=1458503 RepID=A0AAP1WGK5_9FLAO|nr:deoxyribodipyrimidine photo-lyase [Tenacibaculum finnmarkense]MBE7653161.1 deoxyribodipyrimidine photo-lyase [Tenacibaculum finnmarkense genomovar finnmarkense]MBE7695469.1 deoxyribodipyrimidine photo-lyase [Tenacibaculum finnmarkense genomovar finnmarkense]MCD8427601.1 DNA photolyase family protein [Tenacibaculum finnmarkense genomovar finnmarkense]MCG8770400.1 deoxyribodipyrimidine photo-lyase [Tenacibaculum finnmarkense]MCG8775309.1 deoxyribodipyrimidine photo-lyase [Tenacibaculum finnma